MTSSNATTMSVHSDEPNFLAHLFDAHHLPSEHGAEIDFLPIEADAAARGHCDCLVVEWVVELGQTHVWPS